MEINPDQTSDRSRGWHFRRERDNGPVGAPVTTVTIWGPKALGDCARRSPTAGTSPCHVVRRGAQSSNKPPGVPPCQRHPRAPWRLCLRRVGKQDVGDVDDRADRGHPSQSRHGTRSIRLSGSSAAIAVTTAAPSAAVKTNPYQYIAGDPPLNGGAAPHCQIPWIG